MKFPQLLRSRIVLFFCGYLAVLMVLYSFLLIVSFRFAEDLAFNRELSTIANRIAQHVEVNRGLPDVLPAHITACVDLTSVPPYLQEYVKDHEPGVFEVSDDIDIHAAIVPITSTGNRLFVFYDVASIESPAQLESIMAVLLLLLGLGFVFLGWMLARSLSNRIITPVTKLTEAVQTLSLNEEGARLHFNPTPDEVGTLGITIDHLLFRISEFTRREREFTSHASHELRTPVTVIKGAMEILKGRSDETQTAIRQPLDRIERAVADMERLIDTFLMLARQKRAPDQDDTCDLRTVVTTVVAMHHHLLERKPVEVEVRTAEAGLLQTPAPLVTIALGNLIRNAFQYTTEGRIRIVALSDRVSISDNGPGIDSSRRNSGLGLTIVARLCERMGWAFVLSGYPGEGTRAELIFPR